ncbi:MAG: PAS domain S-box protein [Balneola sp.]
MSSTLEIENPGFDETEKRLQLLYQITSQTTTSLHSQLDKALELTTGLLGMDVGIISSVSEEQYTVRNFYPEDSGLTAGQSFELGNTYCSITLDAKDVFSINHMKESEYERHPCYEAFSLEAYIGIPIIIDDKVYGTINFSSSEPKKGGFISVDHTLIKLLGKWVGATIKREQIENNLRERNRQFKLVSLNSADLICLHDLEGNYEFISPSIENILGYTYQELLGKNHYDFVHEEDLQTLLKTPKQILIEKGVIKNTRYRIRNKKGEYIWFESSVNIIYDENELPVGLQSVSRDVTARKKLEIMFEQAQEMASIGGWEFNLETGEIYWSDEVYRIHGKEIGTELNIEEGFNNFPGEAAEKLSEAIESAIENQEKYDIVLPFISDKGTEKWVRALGKPHVVDGNTQSLSGTFQDISKQIKYEKRIITQNEELLRLTETRDKLYSIIAHDLKGAFFGITGMLNMMIEDIEEELEEMQDKKQLRNLNLLHGSSKNAYELLENLLDWIKVQNGTISVEKEIVDIAELLTNAISVFESSAEKKSITIKREFSELTINADKNILSTVFRNLISNAIKFTPQNGRISLRVNESGKSVEISVKDSGIGMTKEIKDKLFDKENRPQRRGTLHEKGTGLGLLLCYDMIEAHDGIITVISEENRGSEFIVSLSKS